MTVHTSACCLTKSVDYKISYNLSVLSKVLTVAQTKLQQLLY